MNKSKLVIITYFLLITLLGVVSCGGGTSSNSTINEQTKAKLTNDNNQTFIEASRLDTSFFIADSDIYYAAIDVLSNGNRTTSVSGDITGKVGVSGKKTSDSSVQFTFVFNNYSDETGSLLSGTLIEKINWNTNNSQLGSEYLERSKMEVQLLFKDLQVKDELVTYLINGEMTQKDSGGYLQTLNMSFRNLNTGEIGKYNNYKIISGYDKKPVNYQGNIYNSKYGYITVNTVENLSYGDDGLVQSGGVVSLLGDHSAVLIKQGFDQRLRIETNQENGSGTTDVKILNASSLIEIDNAPPVVAINLPSNIYTDTLLSADSTVVAYDPDLDDITLTYTWAVNNQVKSSEKQFDANLFKKHDNIKLLVTATDSNQNLTSLEKTQSVLNSKPIVVLNEINNEVEITSKILLDASDSYDPDGDEINYQWSIYLEDDFQNQNLNGEYLESNSTNDKKYFKGDKIYHDTKIGSYQIKVSLDDNDQGLTDKTFPSIQVISQNLFNKEVRTFRDSASNSISSVALADINKDGNNDLVTITSSYVSNLDDPALVSGKNILVVYFQDSFGNFNPSQTIALENNAPYDYTDLMLVDVSNDNLIDLVIRNPDSNSNELIVYYQDIDHNFSLEKRYKTKEYDNFGTLYRNRLNEIGQFDLNNDNLQDIVTHGFDPASDGVIDFFIQQPDSTLVDKRQISLSFEADYSYNSKLSSLDIDNNGFVDLVIGNSVLYQDGAQNFTEINYNNLNQDVSQEISFIDLNEDGYAELLTLGSTVREAIAYPRLFIFSATDDTHRVFSNRSELELPLSIVNSNIFYTDVTNDNLKDIVIPGFKSLVVFVNKGDGSYLEAQSLSRGLGKNVLMIDMNADGKLDFVTIGVEGKTLEINYVK